MPIARQTVSQDDVNKLFSVAPIIYSYQQVCNICCSLVMMTTGAVKMPARQAGYVEYGTDDR